MTQIVQAKGQVDDIIATGQAHTERKFNLILCVFSKLQPDLCENLRSETISQKMGFTEKELRVNIEPPAICENYGL